MEDEIVAGKSPAIQYLERTQNTEDSGIVVTLPDIHVWTVKTIATLGNLRMVS